MQSAFESAIARRLLSSDGAVRILASRRREAAVRMADAVAALGVSLHPSRCFGHHVWLDLPSRWPVRDFVDALRRERVLVTGGDAFTLDPGHPARGVRICLGAVPRALLKPALECIATTLQGSPVPHSPSH
jgi:DNA-binding transcriptional MocR family regulator